ncbi:MAG: hypothetical protein IJR79_00650 [Clostridia bacterium]|nr:hypothetical protein [Clostridia bacterium]
MNKKLIIPVFLVSALLLSSCGKKKTAEKNSKSVPKPVSRSETEIEEKKPVKAPQVIHYTVKLSGKTLSLYEVDGEMQKVITSIEINPDFYPKEDIKNLENGITVQYKEDGYEILENFAN